jgi:hypothetical protein
MVGRSVFRICAAVIVILATATFAAAKPNEKVKSEKDKSEKAKIKAEDVVTVPEPGVLTLLSVGLLGAGVFTRRLRQGALKSND